jgi:hypothetical protein
VASFALPRFLERHAQERDHAAKLRRVIDHGDLDVRQRTIYHDPADALTLRGIPAIGRGVAGVIRGTSPGAPG